MGGGVQVAPLRTENTNCVNECLFQRIALLGFGYFYILGYMATNNHAIIRYQTLDKCFSNFGRIFFIGDLIIACNRALFEFTGDSKYKNDNEPGISRRQIFDDIRFMESSQGWNIPLERKFDGKKVYYRYAKKDFSINNQPLLDEEVNKLREMMLFLNRFKGLPQFTWMEEIITNLEDKFHL